MLYDPKWNKNPTLSDLVAWLEIQPADTEYAWFGRSRCVIEQFAASRGISDQGLYCDEDKDGFSLYDRLTPSGLAAHRPHTFGAALERARAVLAKP